MHAALTTFREGHPQTGMYGTNVGKKFISRLIVILMLNISNRTINEVLQEVTALLQSSYS